MIALHPDQESDLVVVRPGGELDTATAPALRRAFVAAVEQETSLVVVDFADVTFADSTALSVLMTARDRLDSEHRSLMVVNVHQRPMKVFSVTGLVQHLGVVAAGEPLPERVVGALARCP